AIVETLVPFSEKINATVIAEGIESIREYKTLKSLGVKYGQGFLFALPKKPPLSVELNRVNE
ncbi:MAG TPA: EAL domain-containing protein, partial [candidate division WOR-3 bacterium]|nr:EAL domain-containing protein [candidate division WOR-3 bacterium]